VVIMVAALLSGIIDRSDVPQVGVFLALGAILGPAALRLLNVSLDSPILRVVATLSLVLVLFTDAVSLSIARCAAIGCWLLPRHSVFRRADRSRRVGASSISLPAAVTLGAALASTDPRPRDAPRSIETSRFAGGS
jgi:sodium/hydrogen antiporter